MLGGSGGSSDAGSLAQAGGFAGAAAVGGSASGSAGSGDIGEAGADGTGGTAGAGPGSASCLQYCDRAMAEGCATLPAEDCGNFCRQSFGPLCPGAKEVLFACVLEKDLICDLAQACPDEYQIYVDLGCMGTPAPE